MTHEPDPSAPVCRETSEPRDPVSPPATGAAPPPAVAGTRTFQASAAAYDGFMGRYSRELAPLFAAVCVPAAEGRFLDVGCGPGALTAVAVECLGSAHVVAVDPTAGFVEACRARHPGVEVHCAPVERLPFADDTFDGAAAQLVFHFVSDPVRGAAEMARVVRPGGVVAAVVWDFAEGMEVLRAFWDAALSLDPAAPDEARVLRFGAPGELAGLFHAAGLQEVQEGTLSVSSRYADFEEVWAGFMAGIGPAGAYTASRSPAERDRLRSALNQRLGAPSGPLHLGAVARLAHATVPAPGFGPSSQ